MSIEKAIVWFGIKELTSNNANSKVVVKVYNLNGTGTNSTGTGQSAPGTSIATADLLAADIDTMGWNIVSFTNPVLVTNDFAAGVDFTKLAPGDTVALFSSIHGGGNMYWDLAWEQWSDGSWYSFGVDQPMGWDIDLQLGIFPIVNVDVSGMENIKNEKFKLYQNIPNPFSNTSHVFYELTEAAPVSLEVFDLTGKSMTIINAGFQSAGKSLIKIDASDYPAGIYHYTITIGDQRSTKKMVVF